MFADYYLRLNQLSMDKTIDKSIRDCAKLLQDKLLRDGMSSEIEEAISLLLFFKVIK